MTDLIEERTITRTDPPLAPPVSEPVPPPLPAPDTTVAPGPPPTPLPPFAPPGPHDRPATSDTRRRWALIGFALAAVAAITMALLWNISRTDASRSDSELDTAVATRDDATAEVSFLRDRLDTVTDELDAVDEETANVATLESDVDELQDRVERLGDDKARLEAALAQNPPAPAALTPAQSPSAAAVAPEFARYIGDSLVSRNGTAPLPAEQSRCFGSAVIVEVGVDPIGEWLNDSAARETTDAMISAMRMSAETCDIDRSMIFR